MIDQKQVMQLIGEWGYSARELKSYVESQMERAKELGEAVGATAYASLIALCNYALSGDADKSIRTENFNPKSDFIRKLVEDNDIGEEFFEIVDSSDFSDNVLDSLYETCSEHKNYKDAEIAVRHHVMFQIAPLVIDKILAFGSNVSEQVMQCIVGADNTSMVGGGKMAGEVSKTISEFALKVTKYADEMRACEETSHEPFNEIAKAVIGDVDELITEVNHNILSIIDKPPHVWARYSLQMGRFMSAFVMSIGLGLVSYDDYEVILEEFGKAVNTNTDKNKDHMLFGRN